MNNKIFSSIVLGCFTFGIIYSDAESSKVFAFSQLNNLKDNDTQTQPTEFKTTFLQAQSSNSEVLISVSKIDIVGATVFTAEDFAPILETVEEREVTFTQLEEVAQAITKLYVSNGYITSRAILAPQDIEDGVVVIEVVEGSISEIQIEGNDRLNTGYISSRLELGTKIPVNINDIEEQLQLLRTNSLIESIEANLQPASGKGESILVVTVEEANAFHFGLNFDNYGVVSTGSERAGIFLRHDNVFGIGDSFGVGFDTSTTWGRKVVDINYNVPVNAMDGSLNFKTIIQRNEITELSRDSLTDANEQDFYELRFRQPIIRSLNQEFALSLGFSYEENRQFDNTDNPTLFGLINNFTGYEEDGENTISVIKFGQDYLSRDTGGIWAIQSQFNFGVPWFGATDNSDRDLELFRLAFPDIDRDSIPDGSFFSWQGSVQRVQRFNSDHLLLMQANIQLTPDSLLPSQQFVIGGGQSVRGYRSNIRSGDNGIRFSLEDRITVVKNEQGLRLLTIAPFFDLGYVWYNDDNPLEGTSASDDRFLAGVGLGLISEPVEGLTIRIDYAPPLIDVSGSGNNLQDDGFYFSINYTR